MNDPELVRAAALCEPLWAVSEPVGAMVMALVTERFPPPLRMNCVLPPPRPVMVSDLVATLQKAGISNDSHVVIYGEPMAAGWLFFALPVQRASSRS